MTTLTFDHEIGEHGTLAIKTPDGIIMISRFPKLGTGVTIYEDPDDPLAIIHITEKTS